VTLLSVETPTALFLLPPTMPLPQLGQGCRKALGLYLCGMPRLGRFYCEEHS
jgi:hypothetical protein